MGKRLISICETSYLLLESFVAIQKAVVNLMAEQPLFANYLSSEEELG